MIGGPNNDGSAMLTAVSDVGVPLSHMQYIASYTCGIVTGGRNGPYCRWWFITNQGGILVNKNGKRFVTEKEGICHVTPHLAHNPDGCHYVLADQATWDRTLKTIKLSVLVGLPSWTEERVLKEFELGKNLWKADTLEELCQKSGMNLEGLKGQIELWNKAVETKNDTQFGRTDQQHKHRCRSVPHASACSRGTTSPAAATPAASPTLPATWPASTSRTTRKPNRQQPILWALSAGSFSSKKAPSSSPLGGSFLRLGSDPSPGPLLCLDISKILTDPLVFASRAWISVERHLYEGGSPRFISSGRGLHSFEGKTNRTGIIWKADPQCVTVCKHVYRVRVAKHDDWLTRALQDPTDPTKPRKVKYCPSRSNSLA